MEKNFIEIWAEALDMLKEETSPIGYSTYIEVMIPRLVDKTTLCLLAPSTYHVAVCQTK